MPLHAAEHFYIVTEPMAEVPRDLPVLRVTDECTYYKEDAGKLLVGAFEPVAKPWGMDGIPEDFCFDQLPEDMDHFEPILREAPLRACRCWPRPASRPSSTARRASRRTTATCSGETAEVRDLFVATGFNSIGIQSSGGAGKVLAEWIRDGASAGRPHRRRRAPRCIRSRAIAAICATAPPRRWACSTPCTGPTGSTRPPAACAARRFHDRLVAAGAVWARSPAGSGRTGTRRPASSRSIGYSCGRQNWFEHTAAECRAVRDAVALFDQSSFAKFLVEGRDACAVLNRICASRRRRARRAGSSTPNGCNERGGIEADLTVTRLAETRFLVVTGAAVQTRDLAWLRRHIPAEARCSVVDITSACRCSA